MTPIPQEYEESEPFSPPQDGDRIVISGMSGLYPQAHNVQELSDMLYNKINPVTSTDLRFKFNHPEISQYAGTIPDLHRFDAQFFKVYYALANEMDPMAKKILEQTFQALYDAGVNPHHLSGKKVGVYIGTSYSEADKLLLYTRRTGSRLAIAGCCKTMFANRISYWLNIKGPSMAIDGACCSATGALEQACLAIKQGYCEAAIVGGSNVFLLPQSSIHYGRLITTCKDGKTKSFDERADGCAKSEAINVLFLQKAKDALRIYAEVMHIETRFMNKLKGNTDHIVGFCNDLDNTVNFIKKFYDEARVSPQAVENVEAFGSALPELDKVELQAIEKVFCEDRQNPLTVGSVMSNIGYGEAASGISAITKVLLGFHYGELAANLHCKNPRQDIAALRDGRMRILTKHQLFGRGYVAVNGLSVTGLNSHVLLHGRYKPKDLNRYKTCIPYLVNISGRHEEAVEHILTILKSNPIDPEQLALLHNIHRDSITGHMARGYVVLQTTQEEQTAVLCQKNEYFNDMPRPLWFVYSGMGSQWAGMGTQLMHIPIFAAAIERCRRVLEPKGVDIVDIITSTDESTFDNILNSFVGIAAIQIGLTDILRELGLKPDGIIGHSVGELGCAYADGCLTAEEMILSVYYRGLVSLETKFIHGSMAAVGKGYAQISQLCPPEIQVACHNGPNSSTLAGPSDAMRQFVEELTARGIFAKLVPTSNIAYHSRYIADAGPGLLQYLKEVIPTPKPRSERWLSTSVPAKSWDEPIAKLCSAEYFTNNLLSPVLFEETSRLVPTNAVLVEIAPHGLLQAILNRSMPNCKNIPLTRRNHPDNTFFLDAIGKLFVEGFNSNLQVLYPKIEMPVSTGTPFLSHFTKWAHAEDWYKLQYTTTDTRTAAICKYLLTTHDKEYSYLRGYSIRGNTVFPFAAGLTLVWDTLAMVLGVPKKKLSVEFSNIQLYVQPIWHDRRELKLTVEIHKGQGRFQILDGISNVATGFIKPLETKRLLNDENFERQTLHYTREDVYQLLRERDYFYSDEFQCIECVDESLSAAVLEWRNNWVTFIDGMLQLNALRQQHHAVSQPTSIRTLHIDVEIHNEAVCQSINLADGKIMMKAKVFDEYRSTRSGGVLMESIQFQHLPPLVTKMELKTLKLEPNFKHGLDGEWRAELYLPVAENTKAIENISLESVQFGDKKSLEWVQASELTGSGVTVNVHYASINNHTFKDVNTQNAKYYDSYAMDFSGLTESGQPVMGLVPSGTASTQIRVQPELLWPVPAHWSLEDAATVPLAYLQAFYCLGIKVRLIAGQSVLVHGGGAGALGQAIISIALAHGCEVFTTVGDARKKSFLQKLYPALSDDHIGSSHDETLIYNNRRYDIIISCAKGILKEATLNCTAPAGIFLDISQFQKKEHYDFGMFYLTYERNYYAIDFSSLFEDKNTDDIKALSRMISEGIAHGYVRPLSRVTYAPQEVSRAFRLLSTSRHCGRVLLRMKENTVLAQFSLRCCANHCHLVVCNQSTFGLHFADRLVARGAKHLCLHVPKLSSYIQHKIRTWQRCHVNVIVSSEKIVRQKDVAALLTSATNMGPVEGIYVTSADKDNDIHPDLISYFNLELNRLCLDVRHFVVISLGGNVIGKNVCLTRLNQQLPATTIEMPELRDGANISWHSAVDAAERALENRRGVFLAHVHEELKPSIIQQISTLTGLSIPESVSGSATLRELGIQKHTLQPLCSFLQLNYNLAYDEDQLPSLTIDKIMKAEKQIAGVTVEDKKSLSTLFSYVVSHELFATTELIFLPSLANSMLSSNGEFQPDIVNICIIPGMEGLHKRFKFLSRRLKLSTVVLQPGIDHPQETPRETAERLAKVLLTKIEPKETFYLLGYETGVIVALEVAAILEDHGLTGTVFCMGCEPHELQNELKKQIESFEDEKQLEDGVLCHMYGLITGDDATILEHELQTLTTFSQKLEASVHILLRRASHSAQYMRSLIEYVLARIKMCKSCSPPARALRSQLVLLRAARGRAPLRHAALQQLSQQPVVLHELDTTLAHIATDLRCPSIINEHLDPVILENFNSRNICDMYTV